ncbi:hypothetical protein [Aeromonas sp. sia0103]|uniref:hypothetical protein n=1 Tax=Aeromonas sp. sia0103 TaxID=2854782 RepID=UPI001C4491B0|nr:hypothetical protein [Aeromonas sp. sia0103]MBV7598962.1 hypothetical protein [Aeromonas sp. sia0103]
MDKALRTAVEIFKLIEEPEFDNSCFSGVLPVSPNLLLLVETLIASSEGKYVVDLSDASTNPIVDRFTSELDGKNKIKSFSACSSVLIEVIVPQNENGYFYSDLNQWLTLNNFCLSKEMICSPFYIIDDSILSEPNNELRNNAELLCEFINKLKKLANYHDEKSKSGSSTKLVFVKPGKDDSNRATLVIDSSVTSDLFKTPLPDFKLIDDIALSTGAAFHQAEKISVFKTSLIEVAELSGPMNNVKLVSIIQCWPQIIDSFNESWDNYLNNFSFHKIRSELAEQQVAFTQKLTDTVISLSGKLLTIPVSIGTLTFFDKYSDITSLSLSIYFLAAIVLVYSVRGSIAVQYDCLKEIQKAYQRVFIKKRKGDKQQSEFIDTEITNIVSGLDRLFGRLERRVKRYLELSWLPLLALTLFFAFSSLDSWFPFYQNLLDL